MRFDSYSDNSAHVPGTSTSRYVVGAVGLLIAGMVVFWGVAIWLALRVLQAVS